ncbi:microtubule nucleation factor SSNA1-like isoform X2 [Anthonomus grandis grandis]|uniref:microtubule nucleation factor SSNA1-like isoform X2 n=1 Tax=Anthonomus grandis grandis TaxID=2921223 RepID=UPI0021656F39|nr:microtubule nucleation factor SSNA1-like isoform X2 [Anthonomus grandis grandis]
MSEHGAALQTFNEQLVKCLEELKSKRNDLVEVIQREEAEKIVLEKNIRALQDKLAQLNNSLSQHRAMCSNYDKTIEDTEFWKAVKPFCKWHSTEQTP